MTGASVWRRRLPLLAASAVFLAANLALFATYRSSSRTRREALEARREELRSTVTAHEAEAARLTAQKERLSGISEAIQEFYGRRIGSQRETLAAIIQELHAILATEGVATSQISYTTTSIEKLPLARMGITFGVRCDYARFKRLLKAFERSRRWLVVREVSITRDADQPGSVQVQLSLVTYFAGDQAPPEAVSPPRRVA